MRLGDLNILSIFLFNVSGILFVCVFVSVLKTYDYVVLTYADTVQADGPEMSLTVQEKSPKQPFRCRQMTRFARQSHLKPIPVME